MGSKHAPHLVFMKTSTVEKILHFQMIADELKLPIIFADVRDLAGTQHSTDEFEGSVEGNANAKFEEFGDIPGRMMRKGDPLHENAVAMCNKYGMEFDPSHIHVAVDDFEWGLQISLSHKVESFLSELLPKLSDPAHRAETFKAINHALAGEAGFPAADELLGDPARAGALLTEAIENKYGIHYAGNNETFAAFLHAAQESASQLPDDHPLMQAKPPKRLAETDGFKTYVEQHTLDRATAASSFPGPELAPFISALSGNANMLRGLKTGVREVLGEDTENAPSAVSVVFQYQTLDALQKTPEVLTGKSSLNINVATDIQDHFTVKDVASTPEGTSAADPEFFLRQHPRTQVLLEFAQAHGIEADPQWQHRIHTSEPYDTTHTVPTGYALIANDRRKQSYVARTAERSRAGTAPDLVDMAAQFTDRLRMADELLAKSDAVVFMPSLQGSAQGDEPSLDITAIARQFVLSSAVVAKQLNLRDGYKPFIVVNHRDEKGRGSYDRDFEIFDHLLHSGMMKDYTLGLEQIKPEGIEAEGVSYRKTLYFDLLEGEDLKALAAAKERLLEHYREHYYRPPALTTQDNADLGGKQHFKDAVEKGKDIFKVGVFLSASSENLELNKDTREFGKWLAENEFGVVFGGGDRYLMGSLHEGYQLGRTKDRQHFEAGFSTPEIVKSETKQGKLPENMDVSILNKDIYERMGQMIALTDDAIIIRPGGPGTIQELAAVLLMKEAYGQIPEVARKKIIIQNPPLIEGQDPFYDPILERLFGDKYQTLKAESEPGSTRSLSQKLGIYVARSDDQVKDLLAEIRGDWQARQAARQETDEPQRASLR